MESFIYVAVYNQNGSFYLDIENSKTVASEVVVTDEQNFCYLVKLVVIK